MYNVYILKSLKFNRYYIGHSKNLEKRLKQHNQGKVKSTKAYRPWECIYTESFVNKQTAYKREMEIKAYKSGLAFKKLIKD